MFGVPNGGWALSQSFFNVFTNTLSARLHANTDLELTAMLKYCLLGVYYNYADDTIPICPSIRGLQYLFHLCSHITDGVGLKFSSAESFRQAIG